MGEVLLMLFIGRISAMELSLFFAENEQLAGELWNCCKDETFPKLCLEILYREAKEILTNMEVDNFG